MIGIARNGGKRLNDRQRKNLNSLALQAELRERVKGEVRFDAGTRAIYAHDSSKYMREIVEVNPEEGYARVQPGVVRDQLSHMTEEQYNLTFAPDTSTHAYATFGGMIGNNSCGVHSVMAGRTSDNVEELEIVTHDGLRMRVGETSEEGLERIISEGGRRGEIYTKLKNLRDKYAGLIRQRYPDIPRRV